MRIHPKDIFWPIIGLGAVALSIWLLIHELRGISLDDIVEHLAAIRPHDWLLSAGGAVLAYAALAGYDRIALMHLGRHVSWLFITVCSFTTYALSHNIGASVLSGAVVRYRAYGTKGLSVAEIGILVALCSFTFVLGTVLLGGLVLIVEPGLLARFHPDFPPEASVAIGLLMLALVSLYVFGSWLGLRPVKIAGFQIHYPRLPVVMQQLVIGPLELVGAAAIIYFALPEAGNPGYPVILGIFVASFSIALISHAPGGIGVLEYVFVAGLHEMDPASVLAALLVFRLFYLIIPFIIAIAVVLVFERGQLSEFLARRRHHDPKSGG